MKNPSAQGGHSVSYGIRLIQPEGDIQNPDGQDHRGEWVESYDPNAMDGLGALTSTADPTAAISFTHPQHAWAYWRQQSTTHPLRHDGPPNRPLTAYTVSVEPLPPEQECPPL